MTILEQLHETEGTTGVTYPPSFVSKAEEFSSLLRSERFQRAFPEARLLLSAPEIAATRENVPDAFLPFMREGQPSWPDIYAFDFDSNGPEFRVVVWSDHAVVMDWESFPVFLEWVHEHIATHGKAA